VPLWIPVSASWLASGFLVAWSCWKLPFAVYQAVEPEAGTVWPEQLGVASVHFLLSIVAGAAMLKTVLRAYRARRGSHLACAVPDERTSTGCQRRAVGCAADSGRPPTIAGS
jgi:hypothetical protein